MISYYSIKLYINNKEHEENDYTEKNDIYYVPKDKGSIISQLNRALNNRTADVEDLKEKRIQEIVVYDGFKLVSSDEKDIFKVIYNIPDFQQRFSVKGEKINNNYVFKCL